MELKDEFENSKNYTNTVNAKYLNTRNNIFHYDFASCDFDECIQKQKKLGSRNMKI